MFIDIEYLFILMSNYDYEKKVHIIVHGQKQMLDTIKSKLSSKGFKDENLLQADLNKPGDAGDLTAMLWPPMGSKEIILSQIIDHNNTNQGMGAWGTVNQKELERIPL